MGDKGFPPAKIRSMREEKLGIHFLPPIKRYDARIRNNDMLKWQWSFKDSRKRIKLYKEKRIKWRCYLYSFINSEKGYAEENRYIEKKRNNFIYSHFKVYKIYSELLFSNLIST